MPTRQVRKALRNAPWFWRRETQQRHWRSVGSALWVGTTMACSHWGMALLHEWITLCNFPGEVVNLKRQVKTNRNGQLKMIQQLEMKTSSDWTHERCQCASCWSACAWKHPWMLPYLLLSDHYNLPMVESMLLLRDAAVPILDSFHVPALMWCLSNFYLHENWWRGLLFWKPLSTRG